MSYINTTISTNTDEKSFIKKFVEELTAFQGITAVIPSEYATFDDYIDAQFELTSGYPTFSLMMNGFELIFTRNAAITSGANGYTLSTLLNSSTAYLMFCQGSLRIGDTGIRSIKVSIAAKRSITALYFGSYNSTSLTFSAVSISLSADLSACAVSNVQGTKAIASAFSLSNDLVASKIDRCNYTYDTSNATNIEVIKNKIFVSANSASRMFTVNDLWDVSTVPVETNLTIGGKNYFSLDNHTIMEV